jgi:hypothetical protein
MGWTNGDLTSLHYVRNESANVRMVGTTIQSVEIDGYRGVDPGADCGTTALRWKSYGSRAVFTNIGSTPMRLSRTEQPELSIVTCGAVAVPSSSSQVRKAGRMDYSASGKKMARNLRCVAIPTLTSLTPLTLLSRDSLSRQASRRASRATMPPITLRFEASGLNTSLIARHRPVDVHHPSGSRPYRRRSACRGFHLPLSSRPRDRMSRHRRSRYPRRSRLACLA